MGERSEEFLVAHVKLPGLTEGETFVVNRILNPYCKRPVPLLTHYVNPLPEWQTELELHEVNRLPFLARKIDLGLENHIRWSPFFFRVLQKRKPQVIHAHYSGAGELCLLSARALKIPLVVNFYGIETNYQLHDPAWKHRYLRLYRQVDHFICSSDHMRTEMIASGCPEYKITTIYCGVDPEMFNGAPQRWMPGQVLRLLTVARLHPEKGIADLLEACQLLNDSGFREWQLQVIGTGPIQKELEQQVHKGGLAAQVSFLGFKTSRQIADYLNQAHLFILPSLKETQGVVLQEAQATCTPVIASRVGGIPEGVLDGISGFLVEPGNPRSIYDAVQYFIQAPEKLAEMGAAGREYILKNFTRSVEHQKLMELYRSLVVAS